MKTSYSALETFKTCPLKYKYQEIDKIKGPKRIEAVFGTLIHSALKYMFERNPLYPTEDEIIDFFTKRFNEKSEAILWPDPLKKEATEKLYYDEGIKLLKNFYKKNQPWNFNPVELESRFSIEIIDEKTNESHTVAGIIDRIDKDPEGDTYEIIDYKTGKKMPSQESLENNLQLGLYHLSLLARWPNLKPSQIKTSLYFLKHNEKISTSASEERAEKTRAIILDKIAEIEKSRKNNDFPPTPGPLCGWCAYRKICPMWSHEYKKPETPDDKTASEAIAEYMGIKESDDKNDKRLKELRGIILSYMESKKIERVFGGDGYITKTILERTSYDIEKLKPIFEKLGLWEKILEPDSKKINEVINSLPDGERESAGAAKVIKSSVMLKVSKK